MNLSFFNIEITDQENFEMQIVKHLSNMANQTNVLNNTC